MSITMEADFCVEALREAAARSGAPEIVNTDQGSQFSGAEFMAKVARIGARQIMDGKGCWRDNVFVEWPWRSLNCEEVYLKAYESVSAARQGLRRLRGLLQQSPSAPKPRRAHAGHDLLRHAAAPSRRSMRVET
jgi:putative transposase